MKLRNKKTGEIVYATMMASYGGGELQIRYYPVNNAEDTQFKEYRSISELNEEWCDYEEPENFYIVEQRGTVGSRFRTGDEYEKMFKEIGNYFLSREEAEKAVEKLKAWKRLKDKGFRFDGYNACSVDYDIDEQYRKYISEDLNLLFGGEK